MNVITNVCDARIITVTYIVMLNRLHRLQMWEGPEIKFRKSSCNSEIAYNFVISEFGEEKGLSLCPIPDWIFASETVEK